MSSTETTDTITSPELAGLKKPLRKRQYRHRHPKWWRALRKAIKAVNWRLLFVVTIGIVLVAVVAAIALVTDATSRVQGSLDSLNQTVSVLSQKPGTEMTLGDFDRVQAGVDDLAGNIARAEFQTRFLRPVAHLNSNLSATLNALDITSDLTLGAKDMLTGLQPALFFVVGRSDTEAVAMQVSFGDRIVKLLQLGRGQFLSASQRFDHARAEFDRITLSDLSPDMLLNVESLRNAQSQLQNVNNLLLDSPDILTGALGLSTPQTYLILSQNSDELRPSGGYISTYGWLSVRGGRVVGYDYGATTSTSPQSPPPDTKNPYPVPAWWFKFATPMDATWDGSWTPDFTVTAEMAKWYYDNGDNPQAPVDGVISIDMIGFQYILNALGDVSVPEYNDTVTPENFRAMIYDIREHGAGEIPHKRFLATLYKHIFEKWQSITDEATSSKLLGAVVQGLLEKHVMIYSPDEKLSHAVDMLGWSGKQDTGTGHDYLMVADANLGNKSNSSVVRQLTYDVEVKADGSLASNTTIDYDFPASIAEKDPAIDPANGMHDYGNLLQVYLPAKSTPINSRIPDELKIVDDGAHVLLVTRFTLPYNGVESLQFSYTVPPVIETLGPYQRYRLLVQKQPGTRSDPVSVQVKLPKDATVVNASPAPAASYNLDQPVLQFQLSLATDQWIEIVYRSSR